MQTNFQGSELDTNALRELVAAMEALNQKISETKLQDYKPYDFQIAWHHVKDPNGNYAHQKFLQAANQIGKTTGAGAEFAWHVTGEYPDYYKGERLTKPTLAQVSGVTNDTTRDICQKELLGDPEDERALGTGTIPKHRIISKERKPGIPNAVDNVRVRHVNGHDVTVKFRAYEAGFKKFMGHRNDVVWLDEEPPPEIWSQVLRSQIARPEGIILCTFTPENGATQLVNQINDELMVGQGLIIAGWTDAPHIAGDPERMEQLLSQFPPHERDMRSQGVPLMGAGLIFPIPDEEIMIDPIDIPEHWRRVNGLDFGWTHPFAVSFLAWDEQNDVVYMYKEFSQSHVQAPVVASAIKANGAWIPCIWPHDGMGKGDTGKDKSKKRLLEDEGVNMHHTWFTNPPAIGVDEGKGGNNVEIGLMEMHNRMTTGRFKVFSSCPEFFKEKQVYHRKLVNGQSEIVKLQDDVISATRYGVMSLRHSETETIIVPEFRRRMGARNW
jgi:phage terminase large subunit-like protein